MTRQYDSRDLTMLEMMRFASGNLPPRYTFECRMSHDEVSMSLYLSGYDLEVVTDDMTDAEAFVEHINFARRREGMEEVQPKWIEGEPKQ